MRVEGLGCCEVPHRSAKIHVDALLQGLRRGHGNDNRRFGTSKGCLKHVPGHRCLTINLADGDLFRSRPQLQRVEGLLAGLLAFSGLGHLQRYVSFPCTRDRSMRH